MLYLFGLPMYNDDMKWFSRNNKEQNNFALISIIAAAIVAMGISLAIGLRQSVWFDESYSILVAQQKPSEIVRLVSADTHPPAYYLLLHSWGNVFGWNDFALRSLSVLALGGSVVMAGLLVRRLFGARAAIVATAMIAVAPLLLRYGFEIRMYSLAALIGVSTTYVMVKARAVTDKKNARWLWGLYAVLVAVGVLTLYYLALLWVAHVAWLVYTSRNKELKKPWLLPWVWSYVAAFVLFLPWLPKFLSQVNNGALANIGQVMNMEQILGIASFNFLYKPLWQTNVIDTALLLLLGIGAVWAFQRAFRHRADKNNLVLLVFYISIPVLCLMVVSLMRPMYVERYLSHVAIGLMMLAGVLLDKAGERLTFNKRALTYLAVFAVLVVGVSNLIANGNFNFQRMQKPAVAQAASHIDCVGASVVAADPYVATELSYYLPDTCELRFYSEWDTLGGGYAPFNNNPMRLSDTALPQLASKIYYVHYDEPKLTVAPNYHKVDTWDAKGMTVTSYETD